LSAGPEWPGKTPIPAAPPLYQLSVECEPFAETGGILVRCGRIEGRSRGVSVRMVKPAAAGDGRDGVYRRQLRYD
jgi:hypothetical protein